MLLFRNIKCFRVIVSEKRERGEWRERGQKESEGRKNGVRKWTDGEVQIVKKPFNSSTLVVRS